MVILCHLNAHQSRQENHHGNQKTSTYRSTCHTHPLIFRISPHSLAKNVCVVTSTQPNCGECITEVISHIAFILILKAVYPPHTSTNLAVKFSFLSWRTNSLSPRLPTKSANTANLIALFFFSIVRMIDWSSRLLLFLSPSSFSFLAFLFLLATSTTLTKDALVLMLKISIDSKKASSGRLP